MTEHRKYNKLLFVCVCVLIESYSVSCDQDVAVFREQGTRKDFIFSYCRQDFLTNEKEREGIVVETPPTLFTECFTGHNHMTSEALQTEKTIKWLHLLKSFMAVQTLTAGWLTENTVVLLERSECSSTDQERPS